MRLTNHKTGDGFLSVPEFPLEKMALALFGVVVFAVWGKTIHYGHAFAVVVGAVCLVFWMLPSLWFKAFGVYAATWGAWIYSASFCGQIPEEMITQLSGDLLFILAGGIFFIVFLRGGMPVKAYARIISGIALILALCGLYQFHIIKMVPVATLGNQNFLAAFLAVSVPFFIMSGWWLGLPVILWAMIVCKTTTAFIALCAGLLYLAWPKIKEARFGSILIGGLICAAGGWYAFVYDPFLSFAPGSRFDFWLDAWKTVSANWTTLIFGVGPGIPWRIGDMLHSEPAYVGFNFGLVGLTLILGAVLSVPRWSRPLYASCIVVAVDSLGNHIMHTAPTAILALIPIALLLREEHAT
jgi:hypothetical protein